jgi:hypothetical protein
MSITNSNLFYFSALCICALLTCSYNKIDIEAQEKNNNTTTPISLQSLNIEFNTKLVSRTPKQVGKRILGLLAIIEMAHPKKDLEAPNWLKENSVRKFLSPEEKEFFNSPIKDKNLRIQFSWRVEALASLLWAAKVLDEMPPLNEMFHITTLNKIEAIYKNPSKFIKEIELRPNSVIAEMEEHLIHQHWRVRDAQLFEKEMPKELNSSIVYERRYGLSWLVGSGKNWDDVPTDT